MVGNGSGREQIGDSLKHSEGSKGPIERPGMVGNGREWSGTVGSGREQSVDGEFETVLNIPRALRVLSGMVGSGRERSGAVPQKN